MTCRTFKLEWAPIGPRWVWCSAGAQLDYRRRIIKPRPAGTLALPGDAARLRGAAFSRPRAGPGLATVQVTERALPDSGKGLAQWWESHGDHGQSWAFTTYTELIDRA